MPYASRPELYDLEYEFKDYAAECAAIARLVRERKPDARTLLDVACGTGKHLELLRDDFECEGVDLDEGLLELARKRLPGLPLHRGDMRTLDLGRTFDAVTCLFSSIGFVGSSEGLSAAAQAFARHVSPGGVLLVEPWITPDAWIPNRPHALAGNGDGIAFGRVTISGLRDERISTTEMHFTVATPAGFEHFVDRHELYLFTHDEMRAAFEGAGFAVEHDEEGLMGRGLWIGVRR
ncbi:MAG TPA: class I SAM-dependent methyltransferase [Gaiellaceae bacterium]|nr:class I SAM-dependent methyltransferase [Gaiellaceae bacterium]